MTKKSKPVAEATSHGRLTVVDTKGERTRFLRGMITHDLVQHGLSFEEAFSVAKAVREHFGQRDEVTTHEIWQRIEELLGRSLSVDDQIEVPAEIRVAKAGRTTPFSRGLLARSIRAAGLDLGRAYQLVGEIEAALRAEGTSRVSSDDLMRLTAETMERGEGQAAAQRYRMVRQIDRLPRPLVVYIGGASGTGKSTLALDLAPLLRIYQVNSTDSIRQVMRMVFSRQMMPALHGSSFDARVDPPAYGDDESEDQLLAGYEEQARRVNVGVRAMVERAIAEHQSLVIEGVHLLPPLIPFPDLEGAIYQVPLMLITRDREEHRSRFVSRGLAGRRRTERYLEKFEPIRRVHDFQLERADLHDVPLLDTARQGEPTLYALRVTTETLLSQAPGLAVAMGEEQPPVPSVLIIIDGLADRPVRALGGRSPLEAANTPTFDRLAKEGCCGLADAVAPDVVPDTAAGTLALFGQSPQAIKRGPAEAMGAGLQLRLRDVALRGNFATLDANGQVVDRRAGRIREGAEELAKALDRLPLPGALGASFEVRVAPATEHRLAIVLRGEGLASSISGSDPGDGAPAGPPLTPKPLDPDNAQAVETAGLLAVFEQEARRILAKHPVNRARVLAGLLPANAILTRGAGHAHRLVPLEDAGMPLQVVCIGGDRTILGIAEWLGARIISSDEMTANLDTDVEAKFAKAQSALKRADLVVVHLKGADIAAHDRRPDLKVGFLERVDHALGKMVAKRSRPWRLAIAGDHATLSESGQHAADPLPVLLWGAGIEADAVERYSESAAAAGRLGRFPLRLLAGRLFERFGSR